MFLFTELIPASLLLYFGGKYSNNSASMFYLCIFNKSYH